MGMYTELNFAVKLKEACPMAIIAILEYMIKGDPTYKPPIPEDPLFKTERWSMMFRGTSSYFETPTNSILRYDTWLKTYCLAVQCNFKNYDDEIEKFLEWIKPYVYTLGYLGHYRYEGYQNDPIKIYKKVKGYEFKKKESYKNRLDDIDCRYWDGRGY